MLGGGDSQRVQVGMWADLQRDLPIPDQGGHRSELDRAFVGVPNVIDNPDPVADSLSSTSRDRPMNAVGSGSLTCMDSQT